MTKPLLVSVNYRQPFALDKLAPLVAMSVWAQSIRNRAVRRLLKILTRFFLRFVHNRLGFPAPSRMSIGAGDRSPRIVGFDARNTDFGSLY